MEFKISDKMINQRKKVLIAMTVAMPIMLVFFAKLALDGNSIEDPSLLYKILAVVCIGFVIEMIVVSKIMLKKIKTLKFTFTETAIERVSGKFTEVIAFSDITKVKVVRAPSSEIVMISLNSGRKKIVAASLDNMDQLLDIILENVDEKIVSKKTWKVNWNSPLSTIISMIVTALIIAVLMKVDLNLYNVFNKVFMTAFALYFIIFKPISRSAGKRFRKFEIILGSLMLVANIFSIVSDYIG